MTSAHVRSYRENLEYYIGDVVSEALSCKNLSFNDQMHLNELRKLYNFAVDCISDACNLPSRSTKIIVFKFLVGTFIARSFI